MHTININDIKRATIEEILASSPEKQLIYRHDIGRNRIYWIVRVLGTKQTYHCETLDEAVATYNEV